MTLWFAPLIPAIAVFVLYKFYQHKINVWEYAGLVGVPLVVTVILYYVSYGYLLRDTEYWGSWVTKAIYEEAWDEEVPCRHPKYCTRTDSKGNTESYFCGFEHIYDVDYHPEKWWYKDNIDQSFSCTKDYYDKLCQQFGNKYFVDMNRSFHSIDGDAYHTDFKGEEVKLEPVVTVHTYQNKVQVSNNVMNFYEITPEKAKELGLFEYPVVQNQYADSILGYDDPASQREFTLINSLLGSSKQIKVWVLVYHNQPSSLFQEQLVYWKNGNKNEITIGVGVNNLNEVQWCNVFTWCEVDDLNVEIKNKLAEQINHKLNLVEYAKWLRPELEKRWSRKSFKDFDYLQINLTNRQVIMIYIVVLATTISISAYAVRNEYDSDGLRNNYYYRRR